MMDIKKACSETQMMIRKPIETVFQAFIDPEITKNFWFSKSDGKLETGRTLTWEWEMYEVSSPVLVKEVIPNSRISIDWGNPSTSVDFEFRPLNNGFTYVTITHYGFTSTGDQLLSDIKDSTGGFTTVLDGLKAYLEHGINLNLIADKFPALLK